MEDWKSWICKVGLGNSAVLFSASEVRVLLDFTRGWLWSLLV